MIGLGSPPGEARGCHSPAGCGWIARTVGARAAGLRLWRSPRIAYLEPTLTVSLLRPRRRRRTRVLRPPGVFIRARNPCLFTRFRFRGLYVGFIPGHLYRNGALKGDTEQAKVSGCETFSQVGHGSLCLVGPGELAQDLLVRLAQ